MSPGNEIDLNNLMFRTCIDLNNLLRTCIDDYEKLCNPYVLVFQDISKTHEDMTRTNFKKRLKQSDEGS